MIDTSENFCHHVLYRDNQTKLSAFVTPRVVQGREKEKRISNAEFTSSDASLASSEAVSGSLSVPNGIPRINSEQEPLKKQRRVDTMQALTSTTAADKYLESTLCKLGSKENDPRTVKEM